MQEPTFGSLEFAHKKRKTRRERFLERLESLAPWAALEARVEPVYPKPGRGRRPYPLAVMLRVHCVQLCYNLSDPALEDLLYEAESVRRFCGLNLSGPIPDESTILHFRHLLERHQLGEALLQTINAQLAGQGLRLQAGTIVDASIIAAPSSTKNQRRQRDPEMHQTKKGNQWHFGMKLHIGVDADLGLTHSLSTTAANRADVTEAHRLLHGGERAAWGDAGYQGAERRPELADSAVEWRVAMRPGRSACCRRTAHSPGASVSGLRCGPRSSIGASATTKCAIAAWPRIESADRRVATGEPGRTVHLARFGPTHAANRTLSTAPTHRPARPLTASTPPPAPSQHEVRPIASCSERS